MANLFKRKDSPYWWCWGFDAKGERWQRSTRQADRRAANAAATEIERSLTADASYRPQDAHTLAQALEVMVEHAILAKRAKGTIDFLSEKSRHLLRVFGEHKTCESFEPKDGTQYMHQRLREGAMLHTIQKEVRVLVQALRRARKLGAYHPKIDPGELRPDELEDVYIPRDRWLTPEDYRTLLDELAPRPGEPGRPAHEDRRDYVAMWSLTGTRESELYGLQKSDIDFARKRWRCITTKTKGKGVSVRFIPLTPVAMEIVERRKHFPVMFPRWGKCQRDLYRATLRIEARLNPGHKLAQRNAKGEPPPKKERVRPPVPFDPVTPNDLRRTFASWLAQRGVPLLHAARLMGHGSTKMLEQVYAHLGDSTLDDAISLLPDSAAQLPTETPGEVIDLAARRAGSKRTSGDM